MNGHDEKARGNADVKPAMSYIALIAKAILETAHKRLSLGSIYNWIDKNSIRRIYRTKSSIWVIKRHTGRQS
jgi:hypothetical protein